MIGKCFPSWEGASVSNRWQSKSWQVTQQVIDEVNNDLASGLYLAVFKDVLSSIVLESLGDAEFSEYGEGGMIWCLTRLSQNPVQLTGSTSHFIHPFLG